MSRDLTLEVLQHSSSSRDRAMKDELDLPSPDAGSSCERELQQQIDSAGCESSNKVELEARGKKVRTNLNGEGGETRHPVYRGVRRRSWGIWVTEIRRPKTKSRIWLGSFASPEMAALAYDTAALALRGPAAVLNFPKLASSIPRPLDLSDKSIQAAASDAANSGFHRARLQKSYSIPAADVSRMIPFAEVKQILTTPADVSTLVDGVMRDLSDAGPAATASSSSTSSIHDSLDAQMMVDPAAVAPHDMDKTNQASLRTSMTDDDLFNNPSVLSSIYYNAMRLPAPPELLFFGSDPLNSDHGYESDGSGSSWVPRLWSYDEQQL
ncbi:unnamed protein product [Sphagnum balticum]